MQLSLGAFPTTSITHRSFRCPSQVDNNKTMNNNIMSFLRDNHVVTQSGKRVRFQAIYHMVGPSIIACDPTDTPERRTVEIFAKMDINQDGVLTKDEFIKGCLSDEHLCHMLTADPSSDQLVWILVMVILDRRGFLSIPCGTSLLFCLAVSSRLDYSSLTWIMHMRWFADDSNGCHANSTELYVSQASSKYRCQGHVPLSYVTIAKRWLFHLII